jgi:hypothetical protein
MTGVYKGLMVLSVGWESKQSEVVVIKVPKGEEGCNYIVKVVLVQLY